MEILNRCSFCQKDSEDIYALNCGHRLLCKGCVNSIKPLTCPDCPENKVASIQQMRLLIASDNFKAMKSQTSPNFKYENLQPTLLKHLFRNIQKDFDKKNHFYKVCKNFFLQKTCSKCQTAHIEFMCLKKIKAYCGLCRTSSSIYLDSPIISQKLKTVLETTFITLPVFLYYKLKKLLSSKQSSYILYVCIYLLSEFGKEITGFISKCPECFSLYDYHHSIPLVYCCKYQYKHIFCTQCYYKGISSCPIDGLPIMNPRVFYEITDSIRCVNQCEYLGVSFYKYPHNQLLCENCHKGTKNEKTENLNIKRCLMFFKILCKPHRQIANFFNQDKFEACCYYCYDEDSEEVDILKIFNIIQQKEAAFKENSDLTESQKKFVKRTNFGRFLSLSARYSEITELLLKLGELYLSSKPLLKFSKPLPLLPELDGRPQSFYTETLNLTVSNSCILQGLILKYFSPLVSCLTTLFHKGKIIFHLHKPIQSQADHENINLSFDPLPLKPNHEYILRVSFKLLHNFSITLLPKKLKPTQITHNQITFDFFFHSTLESEKEFQKNVFLQGLLINSH